MMYDELIEQLRIRASWLEFAIIKTPSKTEGNRDAILFRKAAYAIEDLITALTASNEVIAKSKPKWIPVTERLPNCNGCYLVWRPHFFGGEIGMPSICYFDGSNTWHDSYGVDFARILHPEDVTHWMPLPQPPESEE